MPVLSHVLETALYAENLDEAAAFYRDVLGLAEYSRGGSRSVFFRLDNQMLLLFRPSETVVPSGNPDLPVPVHGASGEGHACFSATAEELDAWAAHLEAHGVEIEADFRWPGSNARSVYFRDPAGNSLEFAEPKLWTF